MARDLDLCADHQGNSAARCDADERQRLEQLCRTITRPELANGRMQINDAAQVALKRKAAWRDGAMHIVISPLEFMQRLAALVTEGRRYHRLAGSHTARIRKERPSHLYAHTPLSTTTPTDLAATRESWVHPAPALSTCKVA